MKYDGVVIRMRKSEDKLFLFLLNPDNNELMDGINISEHDCYKDLRDTQLMVVDVVFKDGSEELEKVDLEEFIYGETYGRYDTFLYIQDKTLYSIGENCSENEENLVSLESIAEKGDLGKVAINCINKSKIQLN